MIVPLSRTVGVAVACSTPMLRPVNPLRQMIHAQVLALVGSGSSELDLDAPKGDPGLFGPESMVWKVHADFSTMMIGGLASLLMQMLHPGALAGVWDHSNFRQDMRGRLRRTAQFIAGTSYGGLAEAERLIARVRAIHDRVTGTLPDGTPYSANDPGLLTWVHVAEVSCFLAAYRRYRDPAMPGAAQDQYYAEVAEIARRLGASDVPTDRRTVEAYLRSMRPALRCDARTQAVTAALLGNPSPNLLAGTFGTVTKEAAIDVLPAWAAAMHGFGPAASQRHLVRAGAGGIGAVLRWALTDGSAKRAARRMSVG